MHGDGHRLQQEGLVIGQIVGNLEGLRFVHHHPRGEPASRVRHGQIPGPQVLTEHVFSPGALRTHRVQFHLKAGRPVDPEANPVALLQSVNFISRFHHFPEKFMSQVFSGNARGRRREAFRVHFHEHEMDVGAAKPAGQVLHLEPAGIGNFRFRHLGVVRR